jgi:hypothetical protein
MKIISFQPDHIKQFKNYGGQEIRVGEVDEKEVHELKQFGEAYTAVKNNMIIGCAGVIPCTKFRAAAWGLFQRTTHSDFLFVHRKTKEFLENTQYIRIEAYVDPGFYAAVRWIEMLGFKLERPYIPLFFPDGSGASAWALHK